MKAQLLMCLFEFISVSGFAQAKPDTIDLYRLAQTRQLQVYNRDISPFVEGSKQGIRFSKKEGAGVAWINGLTFSNGRIDLDIKGTDILQQSFVGIAFHALDETRLDIVYFRPFNFQATDSVRRVHAVQYTAYPDYSWQRLRKEHEGQYEKAIVPAPNPTEWFHARLVIQYPTVRVYVNGDDKPCLVVTQLSSQQRGKVGIWVGDNSDGEFANLTISPD